MTPKRTHRGMLRVLTDCRMLVLDVARFANLMAKLVDHDLMGGMPSWFLPLQRNSHPHYMCTLPPTETPMCPEGVAWAAVSYTEEGDGRPGYPRRSGRPSVREEQCVGTCGDALEKG